VAAFSKEGKVLIDDAINCLFNAFDTDRAGRLSYKKLTTGLDILCYPQVEPEVRDFTIEPDSINILAKEPAADSVEAKQKEPVPDPNQTLKSDNALKRATKDEPVKVQNKRMSKADREKKTAKSGNSVMERQNALRKEAALKKKQEAAAKRAEEAAKAGGEISDKTAETMDRV